MPYSYIEGVASAGQDLVNSPPYMLKAHVNVRINDVVVDQALLVWNTDSQIELPTPMTEGDEYRVYRTTPADNPVVVFQPGTITHTQLNRQITQALYVIQEAYDLALLSSDVLAVAQEAAEAAAASAEDAEAAKDVVEGIVATLNLLVAPVGITTSALNAKIAAASTAGGGVIKFPAGAWTFTAITLKEGVILQGDGNNTVLTCDAAVAGAWITADNGCYKIGIKDMVLDYNSNANGQHPLLLGDDVKGAIVSNVEFRGVITRNAIRANWLNVHADNGNILVENCRVIDGDGAGLVRFLSVGVKGVRNIRVIGNHIHSGGGMCMIADAEEVDDEDIRDTFYDCIVANNTFIGNGTGTDGPIPTELWGHNGARVYGNTCRDTTRGLGFLTPTSCVASGNTLINQSSYGFEVASCDGMLIEGNILRNCRMLVADNTVNLPGYVTKGLHILNNFSKGSGLTVNGTADHIFIGVQGADLVREDVVIAGNTIVDIIHCRTAIRVDGNKANTKNIRILNNTVLATDAKCPFTAFNIAFGTDVEVSGNHIKYAADYTSANPNYDLTPFMIAPASGGRIDTVNITNNLLEFAGTIAGAGCGAIGISAAASTAAKLRIVRNKLIGTWTYITVLQFTDGDTQWEDNDVVYASGTMTFNAAVILKNTTRQFSAATIPTSGSFKAGDFVWSTAPGTTLGWARLTTGSGHTVGTDWQVIGPDKTGDWTPVLTFGGASTGITYTTQLGRYVQRGKLVMAYFRIVLSSKGSATGGMIITGLPVAIKNAEPRPGGQLSRQTGLTSITSPLSIVGQVGSTVANFYQLISGVTNSVTDANIGNTSELTGTISYEVD